MSRESSVHLRVETEREADGRWIAEVPEIPGVMAYGRHRADSIARVGELARSVLAERAGSDLRCARITLHPTDVN